MLREWPHHRRTHVNSIVSSVRTLTLPDLRAVPLDRLDGTRLLELNEAPVAIIRDGLQAEAFDRLQAFLGCSSSALACVLGIAPRTLPARGTVAITSDLHGSASAFASSLLSEPVAGGSPQSRHLEPCRVGRPAHEYGCCYSGFGHEREVPLAEVPRSASEHAQTQSGHSSPALSPGRGRGLLGPLQTHARRPPRRPSPHRGPRKMLQKPVESAVSILGGGSIFLGLFFRALEK